MSHKRIGKEVGALWTTVSGFARASEGYGVKNKGGGPERLSVTDEHRIRRGVKKTGHGPVIIKNDLQLSISKRTIRRTILRSGYCAYKNTKVS